MLKLAIATVLSAFITSANALNFVESAPGFDASWTSTVGPLDPGVNSVAGTIHGTCVVGDCNGQPGGASGNSQDTFWFVVPTGYALINFTLNVTGSTGPSGFSSSGSLQTTSTTFAISPNLPTTGTTGNLVSSPLPSGQYWVSIWGRSSTEAGDFFVPYTVTLGVSAVPEPSAFMLFGAGGLFVAIARRRTR